MENIVVENWEVRISDIMKKRYPEGVTFVYLSLSQSNKVQANLYYGLRGANVGKYSYYYDNALSATLKDLVLDKKLIYIARFKNGDYVDKTTIQRTIPNESDDIHVILYVNRKYHYEYYRPEDLKKALEKEEEIGGKLLQYCYINDTEQILKRLKNADLEELNQKMKYVGSPLELCARNKNFEGFKAIVEKGANINSSVWPLGNYKDAFRYSEEIASYIYEKFPKELKKVVKKLGYGLLMRSCEKLKYFEMLKEMGANPNLVIDGEPIVFGFIENNNAVALSFFVKNGLDLSLKNKKGVSMISYATKEHAEALKKVLEDAKKK